MSLDTLVVRDPEIMHGIPVFAGTRVPVQNLWDYLEDGGTIAEFLDDFPSVSHEQVMMLLNYFQEVLEMPHENLAR